MGFFFENMIFFCVNSENLIDDSKPTLHMNRKPTLRAVN